MQSIVASHTGCKVSEQVARRAVRQALQIQRGNPYDFRFVLCSMRCGAQVQLEVLGVCLTEESCSRIRMPLCCNVQQVTRLQGPVRTYR